MICSHPMLRSRAQSHDLPLNELPKIPTGLSERRKLDRRICIEQRTFSRRVCSQHEHRLLLCQASASVSLQIVQTMPTSQYTPDQTLCISTLNTQIRLPLQVIWGA